MKTLFAIPGSIVLSALISLAVAIFYGVDLFVIAICVTGSWFAYGKLALSFSFLRGHGVGRFKGLQVFGIPLLLVIFMLGIGGLIITLLKVGYTMTSFHPSTMANILAFGWSMMTGYVVAILHWVLYAHEAYARYSEYDMRVAVKRSTPALIDQIVENTVGADTGTLRTELTQNLDEVARQVADRVVAGMKEANLI